MLKFIVLSALFSVIVRMNQAKQKPISPSEAVDLSEQMKTDLGKGVEERKFSSSIINGVGFRYLEMYSDIVSVPSLNLSELDDFLSAYMSSINLYSAESNAQLSRFISGLKFSKVSRWKKLQFLYTDSTGIGSWIGFYFRKKSASECEFYSNHIEAAFSLMPDTVIVREHESSQFLFFSGSSDTYHIIERSRGFTKSDLAAILDTCNMLTHHKILALT